MDRFRIGHRGLDKRLSFVVRIYDSKEAMYRGLLRVASADPRRSTNWGLQPDFSAIVCPWIAQTLEDDGWHTSPVIGTMLFWTGALTPFVVAHEVMHAAFHHYRVDGMPVVDPSKQRAANFEDECSPTEETVADTYAHLWRELNLKLHDRGHWT